MSNWFTDYRQKWVMDFIQREGFITRQVIVDKFDISGAQATRDITAVRKEHPTVLEYSTTEKRYIRRKSPLYSVDLETGESKLVGEEKVSLLGYCPNCGAKGFSRERRPDGNDTCERGCVYPSRTRVEQPHNIEEK